MTYRDHEHQPPPNTKTRTPRGRIVWATCTVCGDRIYWREGNRLRTPAWIAG